MAIESARTAVEHLPVTPQLVASLRESARLLSTHYSTQIEGNRLSAAEVEKVIAGGGRFPGRERDEREVRNYYRAFEKMEAYAAQTGPITEKQIQVLHGLAMFGAAKATPYRDGQNVIRDGMGGRIVYLPPEAVDVPALMRDLVEWLNRMIAENREPSPVVAALAHYQFATIHPYYDGNGRTARLLTNLILHRCGYGLKGIYTLEEYYARNLEGYYGALEVGGSHNYYLGRAEAEVSCFVEYFCSGMAEAFENVRALAESGRLSMLPDQSALLRELRPVQRQVLGIFVDHKAVTSNELSAYLGLSQRQARELCAKWVEAGFLVVENPSKRARLYRLAERFEQAVRELPPQ